MNDPRGFGECAGFNTRRAARLVGQAFDRALEPTGLLNTQFSVLAALTSVGPQSISELARRLGVDRTTLTRNLKLMERRRMIRFAKGADARVRLAEATEGGRDVFARAQPAWRSVQDEIVGRFGPDRWDSLRAELRTLAAVAADWSPGT